MDTYGMHTIYILPAEEECEVPKPDLNVWVITGDGDSLSIGGNHLRDALVGGIWALRSSYSIIKSTV